MKITRLLAVLSVMIMFGAATAWSGDISSGRSLFNDTRLGANGKSCNSCHADGGTIDGSKGSYTILGSQQESIEDAVNFCIKMALSGAPLENDSAKMKDLVSYLKTLKGKGRGRSETPGY
ncbi:MAG: hypothetical protein OEU95_09470 [Nitrospirota bacterium]|nr:hypothetical protein [Nitrospirota bacterium]